jgi:hypothetical protein
MFTLGETTKRNKGNYKTVLDSNKKQLDWAILYPLIQLRTQCSEISAAFNILNKILRLSEIKLVVTGTNSEIDAEELIQLHETYYKRFITDVHFYFKAWGFCPYVISTVTVDMCNNKKWMENCKHGNVPIKSTKVKMPIITVPSPGTYDIFLDIDENSYSEVITCQARELTHIETKGKRLPEINVFYSTIVNKPTWVDCAFQSPLQSLLAPVRNLYLLESIKLSAQFANANPTFILQTKPVVESENARSLVFELYGESDLNPNGEVKKYERVNNQKKRFNKEVLDHSNKVRENLTMRNNYYSDPMSLHTKIELKRAIETNSLILMDELEVSKNNPPNPQVPTDYQDMLNILIDKISLVFDIPKAFISREISSSKSIVSDNDLTLISQTVKEIQSDLNNVLKVMIDLLELNGYEFEFHSQSYVDPEILIKLFELEVINSNQLLSEFEDKYSLNRKKKKI